MGQREKKIVGIGIRTGIRTGIFGSTRKVDMGKVLSAGIFLVAIAVTSILATTAPIAFKLGMSTALTTSLGGDYPSHMELSQDIRGMDKRLAVLESYTQELRDAKLRDRMVAVEESLSAIVKVGWTTLAIVLANIIQTYVVSKRRDLYECRQTGRYERVATDE